MRFLLTATDRSRLQTSVHIDCQVARSTPQLPATAVKVLDALEMRAGVFAVDPQAAVHRRVCWAPVTDATAVELERYEYWVGLRGHATGNHVGGAASTWADMESAAEQSQGNVANLTAPIELDANETCITDVQPLEHGTVLTLRVAAVGVDGRQTVGEATMIVDATPPEPLSSPIIHTGARSPVAQVSDCCLRVSWDEWEEEETETARYVLCSESEPNECLDVGNSTHVLVVAPGRAESCDCDAPLSTAAASESGTAANTTGSPDIVWTSFEHVIAVPHNGTSFGFTLHAINTLGIVSERTGPFVVRVDNEPSSPVLAFEGDSTVVAGAEVNASACVPSRSPQGAPVDVWHPSGRAVHVTWDPEEADDGSPLAQTSFLHMKSAWTKPIASLSTEPLVGHA